jgi:YbgC/YbaW family acyl-CoA thioester hydrolase
MRARGIDYRRFELEVGKGLPVTEARVRYKRPARFDDELEVETWVPVVNRAKIRFDSRIWRGTELLCEAEITCACVRLDEMRICSMDERIREVFG